MERGSGQPRKGGSARARTATGSNGPESSRVGGSLAVHPVGARGGNRIPASPVGSAARQGECRSRLGARPDSVLFPVRSAHEAAGYRVGFLDGAFWTVARLGHALSVPSLQRQAPALAGSAGRGTRTYQRFTSPPAGASGSRS